MHALHRWGTLAAAVVLLAACPTASRPPSAKLAATRVADAGPSASSPAQLGPSLSSEEVCARSPDLRVPPLAGAKPFAMVAGAEQPSSGSLGALLPTDGLCGKEDNFCPTADNCDPRDACAVANKNIARTLRAIRATRGKKGPTHAWDPAVPPKYLDRIDAHLHLTSEERAKLSANGFVVLDRLPYANYANAFHDVFQEELPLFVGVDPILHAVFRGTEHALERVEKTRLVPALASMLKKLRGGLAESRGRYDKDTLTDLDVYLSVAWKLGGLAPDTYDGKPPKPGALSVLGHDEDVAALFERAQQKQLEEVELFGRPRMVDFSQLEPRGHYAEQPQWTGQGKPVSLGDYFQAVMWLSRTEFNLVSRSCRSSQSLKDLEPTAETPREARDAMALAEIAERSGALPELRVFEEVYSAFAGKREDLSPMEILRLTTANHVAANDPAAPQKLKLAIGEGYQRTARTHFTPEGCPVLPAIATLLGPRIVPDVAPLTHVVHDAIPERKWLSAADLGFVLGHDRAKAYISDLGAFPQLPAALDAARAELSNGAQKSKDLYGSWLRAILAIGRPPQGATPSFMAKGAYADFRLNSALVGYGQLRHTFVLLAAQGYDAYGCEIPDAYVEPVPLVYDALLAHVRRMKTIARGWNGLERVLVTLSSIAHAEADGETLTDAQRRWLGMVSEYVPKGGFGGDSGAPPTWTGWYFDMFEDRDHGATKAVPFIADYFTLTTANQVAYVGADGPRLGVFVVDSGGEPRAMVGPVAKGFELHGPIDSRLDDEKSLDPKLPKSAPWRVSFAVGETPEPALGLEGTVVQCPPSAGVVGPNPMLPQTHRAPGSGGEWRVALRSAKAAGKVSVTLLDHHGDPITGEARVEVGPDWRVAVLEVPPEVSVAEWGVEALHVRVESAPHADLGPGPWDYVTSASVFGGSNFDELETKLPVRPRGIGAFTVGAGKKEILPP